LLNLESETLGNITQGFIFLRVLIFLSVNYGINSNDEHSKIIVYYGFCNDSVGFFLALDKQNTVWQIAWRYVF